MKIPINLASQPFRRDRAMLAASIAVSLLLAGTLGVLAMLIAADRAQMADVRLDIGRLNRQIRLLNAEQAKLNAVLTKPENAEVLEQSVFLNTLLYRKGISWTRIFSDLEKTVPYNVKITAIRPSVDAGNHVTLDMTVAMETQAAYLQLLIAMENSPLFGKVAWGNKIPPNQSDPLWRCQVTVTYAQNL
jgi:type IV pilus assembly protein PilN